MRRRRRRARPEPLMHPLLRLLTPYLALIVVGGTVAYWSLRL